MKIKVWLEKNDGTLNPSLSGETDSLSVFGKSIARHEYGEIKVSDSVKFVAGNVYLSGDGRLVQDRAAVVLSDIPDGEAIALAGTYPDFVFLPRAK